MKILHICLANFFIDNYSYQENMLPKYHAAMGHDVEVLASLESFDKDGKTCLLEHGGKYKNEYNIPVTRLEYKDSFGARKLRHYKGTYEELERVNPDIIFIHGCQFCDIKYVVKYLQNHKNVRVYVDNHADFSNSARNWISKNILHKIIWRSCAKKIEPYTKKFYGVLPARVKFLQNVYKLPKEKCELLIMGADDDAVAKAADPDKIGELRCKYGVADGDFLIVTGGKIDLFKTQTLLLMEAVKDIENVKLLVFGSVVPEMKEQFDKLCGDNIIYIGWINAPDSYKYFAACDFAVFPGRHSVFWEQVAAQAKPMIVKYWDGTTHVDIGGNVRFLYKDSVSEIKEEIEYVKDNFDFMKDAANAAAKNFLYSDIARRSIE